MELTAIRPATVSLGVARRIVGISRNTAYAAAQRGELADGIPVLQVGKTYRVPVTALERVLGVNIDEWLAADSDLDPYND